MTYKLAAMVIHGIGEQKPDFADGFIAELKQRLAENSEAVCWKAVYWADLVESKEADLLKRLAQGGKLEWQWLRRFVVHFLADAVAYQRVPGKGQVDGLYERIHARIAAKLSELREAMRSPDDTGEQDPPLLVLAHSLGGHIMSNYLWDHQNPDPARVRAGTAFARGETLTGMITFGCNIPLFALALPEVVPIAIPRPPRSLRKPWLNLYDPDDVLGYPLVPLSDGYAALVEDRTVNVGGLLTAWNPASHNAYWTDNDATRPIAERVLQLLES